MWPFYAYEQGLKEKWAPSGVGTFRVLWPLGVAWRKVLRAQGRGLSSGLGGTPVTSILLLLGPAPQSSDACHTLLTPLGPSPPHKPHLGAEWPGLGLH